ncbi:hypothetical protein U8V72_25770 [Priestia filamentosa]|uniref:hypothetical protein n=1 Tax=Priestia filamentosa TaxID=1402861 RepID=UPI00397C4106
MNRSETATLLHDLHHIYLLMKMNHMDFTYRNFVQFKKQNPQASIPEPEQIEQTFGSFENAYKECISPSSFSVNLLDVPAEEKQYNFTNKRLKEILHTVYKELKERGIVLDETTYNHLIKEPSFQHFPHFTVFQKRYGSFREVLKGCGLSYKVRNNSSEMTGEQVYKTEFEINELRNALIKAQEELKSRHQTINSNQYRRLREEEEFKRLPHILTYFKRYESWGNTLEVLGLKERFQEEEHNMLVSHLQIAYMELRTRNRFLTKWNYNQLRKEEDYKFLTSVSAYKRLYGEFDQAIQALLPQIYVSQPV